jgi:MerR family copper efflux transcriptional regulator
MRIGELSQRTGVSTSRIRFYEKHKVLPQPVRNGNGYRIYPESSVKILELIDGAQQLGFSLNEIRAGLSEAAPHLPSRAALVKALRGKLDDIDQHMNDVRARRRHIVKLLKEMGDGDR